MNLNPMMDSSRQIPPPTKKGILRSMAAIAPPRRAPSGISPQTKVLLVP